jgi:elongation factor P hydroxylase
MPAAGQQLIYGGASRLVLIIDSANAVTVQDAGAVVAGFWLSVDGKIYRQVTTQAGGVVKTEEYNWLLKGAASDYQVRFTVLNGTVISPVSSFWSNITADVFVGCQVAAGVSGTNDAEVLVEIRSKTTQKLLDSGHWYLKASRSADAPTGLQPQTIRGVGTGSGAKAALASITISGNGTATARYSEAGGIIRIQPLGSIDYNGVRPDGVLVTATKTSGGGSMFSTSAGTGKLLTLNQFSSLLWESREPDVGQQKTVVMNITFYKGTSALYSTTITLQGDSRTGAANPGVS